MAELLEEEEEEDGGAARQSGRRRRVCYKHERAIPVQQTVESLDIREEGEGGGIDPQRGRRRSRRGSGSPPHLPALLSRRHRDPPLLPGAAPAALAGAAASHLLLLPAAVLRGTPAAPGCGAEVRAHAAAFPGGWLEPPRRGLCRVGAPPRRWGLPEVKIRLQAAAAAGFWCLLPSALPPSPSSWPGSAWQGGTTATPAPWSSTWSR